MHEFIVGATHSQFAVQKKVVKHLDLLNFSYLAKSSEKLVSWNFLKFVCFWDHFSKICSAKKHISFRYLNVCCKALIFYGSWSGHPFRCISRFSLGNFLMELNRNMKAFDILFLFFSLSLMLHYRCRHNFISEGLCGENLFCFVSVGLRRSNTTSANPKISQKQYVNSNSRLNLVSFYHSLHEKFKFKVKHKQYSQKKNLKSIKFF